MCDYVCIYNRIPIVMIKWAQGITISFAVEEGFAVDNISNALSTLFYQFYMKILYAVISTNSSPQFLDFSGRRGKSFLQMSNGKPQLVTQIK